ncbi:MAG TPA: GrpB family protein [Armatimonadota bacterium]|jgi:GrpB-like predicted nucleotidyltransferase (UPF0157 family)
MGQAPAPQELSAARLLLVGAAQENPTDYALEYALLPRLTTEVPPLGPVSRFLRFESDGPGPRIKFLGLEVERLGEVPAGLVAWELGEADLTIYASASEVVGQAPLTWQWRAASPSGRLVGEFTTCLPGETTPREFRLCANAPLSLTGEADADDILLAEPDPTWPRQFETMAAWLREALGPDALLRLEHIGSTAVPGLPAKPVLDLLLEVPSLAAGRRRLLTLLNEETWEYWWYGGHAVFIKRKRRGGPRTHHLHLSPGAEWTREHLAFRDYLRAHPEAAARYAALKRELADAHRQDREAYTEAKADFISEILRRAGSIAPHREPRDGR